MLWRAAPVSMSLPRGSAPDAGIGRGGDARRASERRDALDAAGIAHGRRAECNSALPGGPGGGASPVPQVGRVDALARVAAGSGSSE
jgi:hypothetical protein